MEDTDAHRAVGLVFGDHEEPGHEDHAGDPHPADGGAGCAPETPVHDASRESQSDQIEASF